MKLPPESQPEQGGPPAGVRIVYRDASLVAIDKPAGLLVHRTRIDRRETRFALQETRDLVGQYLYPVHRLDKSTSGLLLFALDPTSARALSAQFTAGEVEKVYVAVVRGWPPEAGVVDRPLTDLPDSRHRRWEGERQPARTAYRRLATVEFPIAVSKYPTSRYALVEARPETGKQHQIRRHLRHITHPVIGDARHGEKLHNRFFASEFGVDRLLLASVELAFRHPATGAPVRLTSPLVGSFASLIQRLGWSDSLPDSWLADESPC